jgi:hypothetical protein
VRGGVFDDWYMVPAYAVGGFWRSCLTWTRRMSRWGVDMVWQFYRQVWEAERAFKAAVPTVRRGKRRIS